MKIVSGTRSSSQAVAIEPRSSSIASRAEAELVDEREDRLGVDGHLRLLPLEAVAGEDLLVVQDDPVVDAVTAPWRTGWLLASIVGWPFV